MVGFQLKNISRYLSTLKGGSVKNTQLRKYFDVNALLQDNGRGNISETDLLQILEFSTQLGLHAEADKRAIESSTDVEMTETSSAAGNGHRREVTGLCGTRMCRPGDETKSCTSHEMNQIDQLPHYKDAQWISERVESACTQIKSQLNVLAFEIQEVARQINCHQLNSQIQSQCLSRLTDIFTSLEGIQKLGRRHQALAHAMIGPSSNFRCLYESYADFFKCLKTLKKSTVADQKNRDTSSILKAALERSWILEEGPKRTIKLIKEKGELYKSAPGRPFDVKFRFLGSHDELQLRMVGKPTMCLESKDGDAVTCTVRYGNIDFKDNSLIIQKIKFENFKRLTACGLTLNQIFYTLKIKLQVSYLYDVFDLELKTFPFTVWESAHQIQEATGAVTWLIFSQEENKGDKYELKKDLPKTDVLEMFDLMLQYNTNNGGRHLVKEERQELDRLLGIQNPDNSVTMASIFTDNMKAQGSNQDNLKFSLFMWFQGGLNTLSHFHDYWMKGIIVGFYSRKDASKMLKHQHKEGDAVVRLSQTEMFHPQGETPYTHLTVHIARYEDRFIGSFEVTENSSFESSVLKYTNTRTDNTTTPSIERFLPTKISLSDVFPQYLQHLAGSVETNRYLCNIRRSPETLEPIFEGMNSLTLSDQIPSEQQSPHQDFIAPNFQELPNSSNDHQQQSSYGELFPHECQSPPYSPNPCQPPNKKLCKDCKASMCKNDPMMSSTAGPPEELQGLSTPDPLPAELQSCSSTDWAFPEELQSIPPPQLFFWAGHKAPPFPQD